MQAAGEDPPDENAIAAAACLVLRVVRPPNENDAVAIGSGLAASTNRCAKAPGRLQCLGNSSNSLSLVDVNR